MSTTVIASRFGTPLFFAPWLGKTIDPEALREVLARHGLELLPGSLDGNEFIAGQDLSPAHSARLAADLRALGLTVRVVNKVALTQSSRVANAYAAALMGTMFTLPLALLSLMDPSLGSLTVLAIPGLYFLVNLLTLLGRGGIRLPLAGSVPEAEVAEPWAVQQTIAELKGSLPDHQLEPLLQRARDLESQAALDPDGAAAAELAAMRSEQLQSKANQAEAEAKALRAELARARSAVAETGR